MSEFKEQCLAKKEDLLKKAKTNFDACKNDGCRKLYSETMKNLENQKKQC